METETKITFWHKQAIWIHFTLVYLGIYFSMSLIIQAYLTAFPTDQAKEAQAVSMLLEKTAARAEATLRGK